LESQHVSGAPVFQIRHADKLDVYTLDEHVPLGYDYTAHSRRTILPELLITTRVYHQDHSTLRTLFLGNEKSNFGCIEPFPLAISSLATTPAHKLHHTEYIGFTRRHRMCVSVLYLAVPWQYPSMLHAGKKMYQ